MKKKEDEDMDIYELEKIKADQFVVVILALIKKMGGDKNYSDKCLQPNGFKAAKGIFKDFFPDSEMKFSPTKR